MKATVLPQFGGPEQFRTADLPMPAIADDQMLVRVAACGVCGHDLLNRSGYFPKTRLPAVLGHEIAGEVVKLGAHIKKFAAGDRVALLQRQPCGRCELCRMGRENLCRSGPGFYGEEISGGYGQYVTASELNTLRLPDEIAFTSGAVLGCALGTGYHALKRSGVIEGEAVVVTGAGGGVGLHTLKVARLMGLRSIAITGSDSKAVEIKAAGAMEVVVARNGHFHAQVRRLTDGMGAAAVIEIAGSPTFASSIRSVRTTGRVVLVGNVAPAPVALNLGYCILKEIDVTGSGHVNVTEMQQIIQWVRCGKLAPTICGVVPSKDAAAAHRQMERRTTAGRLVLEHGE